VTSAQARRAAASTVACAKRWDCSRTPWAAMIDSVVAPDAMAAQAPGEIFGGVYLAI
jgi:hypothetical protein